MVSFVGFGGFSTDVVVREGSVAPLPPGMDFFTASCLFVAYGTADYALRVREKQAASELGRIFRRNFMLGCVDYLVSRGARALE